MDNQSGKEAILAAIKAQSDAQIAVLEAAWQQEKQRIDDETRTLCARALASSTQEVAMPHGDGTVEVVLRKNELELRYAVVAKVMSLVMDQLHALTTQSDYERILMAWVVEATLALDTTEVDVQVGKRELVLLSDDFLAQTQAQLLAQFGRNTILQRHASGAHDDMGPMVKTLDGKMAYNNTLTARLERYKKQIQQVIFQELFGKVQ
jgi:vacuolar-type H+-ATPase subunit E/Vma4